MPWADMDGAGYAAVGQSVDEVPPGVYEPAVVNGQPILVAIQQRTDDIIQFPDAAATHVVNEIEEFWKREKLFADHGLSHKRGILLWGPPGAGKSVTMRQIAQDVVKRDGIVMNWARAFTDVYRTFRLGQPDTAVVVLMEDLDTILSNTTAETAILNLLDGVEVLNRVVFVASTNYPERLGERVVNRPSRFDRKVKIGYPAPPARHMYLESLMRPGDDVDLDQWTADTKEFSIAHLKELFVATIILGNNYPDTLRELKAMSAKATSAYNGDDFGQAAGYS